jgi:hypothetical protein
MKKIDRKKDLKALYGTTTRQGCVAVDVPEMHFLMVDGQGDPNTAQAFADAIGALYALAYAIKFMVRKSALALDYGVMPLEALWWADDMSAFSPEAKDSWKWTAMIMQPGWVTVDLVEQVRRETAGKKPLPALEHLRFEAYAEGPSAQCLYVGPYADEGPTIAALHDFIAERGFDRHGKHHEIYLNDMRRTDPMKLRTIIRQPMKPV